MLKGMLNTEQYDIPTHPHTHPHTHNLGILQWCSPQVTPCTPEHTPHIHRPTSWMWRSELLTQKGERQAYTTTIKHLTDLPLCSMVTLWKANIFRNNVTHFSLHTGQTALHRTPSPACFILLENMKLRNTYAQFWITVQPSAPSSLRVFVLNPTIWAWPTIMYCGFPL